MAPFVVFPDGTIGNFDSARQEAMSKLPEGSPERLQLEKKLIEDGATSLIRALDTLSKLERPDRLAGRLDLKRVAVLGHSFGAMSALRVAEKDRRFRAGLSLDGFSDGMLAFAVEDGRRIRGRFGLMFRPLSPNQGDSIPKLIAALPRGTMLVKTESPQFVHMSFSDLPLLRAGDNQQVRTATVRHLEIVRTITRTFFDSRLRGAKAATDLPTHGYPELKVENSTN